jgi:SAM-dependent methyltransferase
MRRTMFLSQDGVVLSTTLRALDELGILGPSLEAERPLAELYPRITEAGFGAQRVAVHSLAAAGWVAEPATLDPTTTVLRWTDAGRKAVEERRRYVAIGEFLAGFASTADDAWTRPWEAAQVERFAALVDERGSVPTPEDGFAETVRAHLDGGLLVPAMLWLHETDALAEAGPSLGDDTLGRSIEQLLSGLGWVDPSGQWTDAGVQARAFGLNFGGVATYLPLLARLPELYRGELTVIPDPTANAPEWHVHRALNIRISAAAHERYFADSEPLFAEIFDREPVAAQPRFIADMGCGEGSWLLHLHRLVHERTRRGELLDTHPLLMVGVDPDAGALERARANLEAAGAPALLISGDVTDPDRLCADLADHGLAMEDGLHIRSFIDHERSHRGGDPDVKIPGWSHGVYMDGAGGPLPAEAVERDLVAHLRRWARHTGKHGMIVLEAHCVAPEIVSRNLGSLHGIAFDAHQAYSKQYPVDHPAFLECCRLAGLASAGHCERRYPGSRPFVAVNLARLTPAKDGSPLPGLDPGAARADTWQPEEGVDLEDGRALHRILFREGDIRFPAAWCSMPTGFVVAGTLATIEARLETIRAGEAVRILDYGAGTGTATIELLKACRERGIDERLASRGASLEAHLVDIPSSWFAQGYELLGECAWTRFHSLRGPGGFRPLNEVLDSDPVDAAMANMVFHLIPPRALERTMGELASVLVPGGRLTWSAPDLGPAGPHAVLLHDPNRALRESWLERAGGGLDDAARREGQDRADKRIRPRPLAGEVTEALAERFTGTVESAAYEMLDEEVVAGLLVPSNQAEFLAEIPDRDSRERTIRELMLEEVLPRMRRGPAGTALGLNLHWTLGDYSKRG